MADKQSQQAPVSERWTKSKFISPQLQTRFWTAFWSVRKALRGCLRAIAPWGFTLAGVVCLAFYTKSGQLVELQPVRDLQLAVGALVGTIVTLGFSLSIIPLQRAAESYSPSILRLFREHRGLQAVFLGLLTICFCCFGLIVLPIFGIDPTATVPLVLLLLGISLDLLRRLYVLITRLLEPQEAVRRLSEEARRILRAHHEALLRASNLSWRSLPAEEQKKQTPEQHLAYFYEQSQAHDDFVRVRSAELAEIAQKATARNDWSLALVTLDAMHRLALDAIECRKSALVFYLADFLVIKATAEKSLDRVYEDLLAVNRTAVRQEAENVSMMVIRTLGRIAEHMTTIRRPKPMQHSAPLAANPISYCRVAVREAMVKGMDDAGYEGAATLAKVSRAAPTNTQAQDVHAFVIDGIFEVLNLFAGSPGKAVHLKEPLDRALEVLHSLVERKDFYADDLTADFLSKLEVLLPFGLLLEVTEPMPLARHPIRPPYDPSSDLSLLALLQRARNLIEPAPNDREAPSWSRFVGFVETVCDHFRRLADNSAVASSALMFSLNASVRQILFLLLDECRPAREVNSSSLDKLEETAGRLIWFYGLAAYHAKAMDHQRTREASKFLGCVGLLYLDSDFDQPALTAAQNITSLAEHGAQKLKGVSIHEFASLLLPLRWIKLLARKMNRTVTLKELEKTEQEVITKLSALSDLKTALDELERQRWRELNQGYGRLHLDPDEPEAMLVKILGRRQQAVDG